MKTQESPAPVRGSIEDLSPTESHLAKVLVLIQRIIPHLDDPYRATETQGVLRKAALSLESAVRAHEQDMATGGRLSGARVESETVAVISAAIAVGLARPYRLVAVQPAPQPVPHLNVWAYEGRTQIFQSHKVR